MIDFAARGGPGVSLRQDPDFEAVIAECCGFVHLPRLHPVSDLNEVGVPDYEHVVEIRRARLLDGGQDQSGRSGRVGSRFLMIDAGKLPAGRFADTRERERCDYLADRRLDWLDSFEFLDLEPAAAR